jgi:hypothetical protein
MEGTIFWLSPQRPPYGKTAGTTDTIYSVLNQSSPLIMVREPPQIDTTLTPPGAQSRAKLGKAEQRSILRQSAVCSRYPGSASLARMTVDVSTLAGLDAPCQPRLVRQYRLVILEVVR